MLLANIVFIILTAFVIAKLEIEIEGKDGWAKNLPTWKVSNKLTTLFLGNYPFTGYHLWAFLALIIFSHFPFFLGFSWSLKTELSILASISLMTVLEDFLWFILNPAYGVRKFNSKDVTWHKWIGKVPILYIPLVGVSIIFFAISYYFL